MLLPSIRRTAVPYTAAATEDISTGIAGSNDLSIDSVVGSLYVATTDNASNYWNIRIADAGNVFVFAEFQSYQITGSNPNNWTPFILPVGKLLSNATAPRRGELYVCITKVGTPGPLYPLLSVSATVIETTPQAWTRQGDILVASQPWENAGILEPCVIYDGSWRMWYRGGGLHGPHSMIGYATSPDGVTWTRNANPVFGNGYGGEARDVAEFRVIQTASGYLAYYNTCYTSPPALKVAASPDGVTWTTAGTCMALPTGCVYWGNVSVWNNGTWHMLIEAYKSPRWQTYHATSSDGLTWTLGPLVTSLQIGTGGWGGPDVHAINGVYWCWYHASTVPGNYSNIYCSSSTDGVNWTFPQLVLARSGTDYETDQVADPHVLEVNGQSFMFYDADDNTTNLAAIKLLTFPGTLAQLVTGE